MMRWNPAVMVAIVALMVGCSSSPDEVEEAPPAEMPEYDEPQDDDDPDEEAEEDEQDGVVGLVAFAEMRDGDEEVMGEVTFTQTIEGVEVDGYIETLDESLKGFHVHEFGECDPPDFETAGGHFNPGGHEHGGPDDPHEERHAGDLGNIEFDDEGVAEFSFVDEVITLGDGKNDVVGKSLIVHYEEDDLETDPTGDAGPRAGCGIIEKVRDDIN